MVKYDYVRHCGVIPHCSLEHEPLCSSIGYFFKPFFRRQTWTILWEGDKMIYLETPIPESMMVLVLMPLSSGSGLETSLLLVGLYRVKQVGLQSRE